jgi:hypothetical protein
VGARRDLVAISLTHLLYWRVDHALQDSLESLGASRIARRQRRDRDVYYSAGVIGSHPSWELRLRRNFSCAERHDSLV